MRSSPVKILKFGGSSVGSVETLQQVISIVKGEITACRPVVVVSALAGITDLLEEIVTATYPEELISRVAECHIRMAESVLIPRRRYGYLSVVHARLEELRYLATKTELLGRTERILAVGELLSAPLISTLLLQEGVVAQPIDARSFIRFNGEGVDRKTTFKLVKEWFSSLSTYVLPVVTGFIASDNQGATRLLGRGGSDYSASLIAEAIQAAKLDRWTDVDGLYTADPNQEKGAGKFLYLVLEDATTWNKASALGMHAEVFKPVLDACIPVHVRSTRFPQGDGTLIIPKSLPVKVQREARSQLAHANHQITFGPTTEVEEN